MAEEETQTAETEETTKDKTEEEYLEHRKKSNEKNRKYYQRHKEKINKWHKEYRKKNKKKISEYGYKLRARPEYKERIKRWREENRERLKEYTKTEESKKRKAISDRNYFLKNRKKVNGMSKKWRDKNREIVRKYNQKYYTSPKGKISYTSHNHRRLSLIKERPCDLTNEKIKKIFKRDKVCVYCGSSKKLELDHIIPLKLGGNSLFNNFVIACAVCNRSKHGRDVFYWCKLQGIEVPKVVLKLLERQRVKALD